MEPGSDRLQRLQRFASGDPGNIPLVCELVDAAIAEGALDVAARELAASRVRAPASLALKFREGSLALAKGEFAHAEQVLRAVLPETPGDAVVLHNLALAQFCQGQNDAALATLEPLQGDFTAHPPLARLAARVLHRLGRPNEAMQALAPLLAESAQDAEARGLAAVMFHEAGDRESARGAAMAALALDPSQHEALLVAATLEIEAGALEVARPLVAQLVENHGKSGHAWLAAGQLAIGFLEFDLADEALGRAAHLMPRSERVWLLAAWCAIARGELAAAQARTRAGESIGADPVEVRALDQLIATLAGSTVPPSADLPANHPVAMLIAAIASRGAGEADAVDRAAQQILDMRVAPGEPTVRALIQRMLAARAGVEARA